MSLFVVALRAPFVLIGGGDGSRESLDIGTISA